MPEIAFRSCCLPPRAKLPDRSQGPQCGFHGMAKASRRDLHNVRTMPRRARMAPHDAAEVAQVPAAVVTAFEAGEAKDDLAAIGAMRDALEAAGIGFAFILDGDRARPCRITFTPAL